MKLKQLWVKQNSAMTSIKFDTIISSIEDLQRMGLKIIRQYKEQGIKNLSIVNTDLTITNPE